MTENNDDKFFLVDIYGDRLVSEKAAIEDKKKTPENIIHSVSDRVMNLFYQDTWADLFGWCRKNLTTLVLLISGLGSIVQVYHLAKMNLSYVKFFSITQLIADGSLILVTILTVIIIYKIQAPILKMDIEKQISNSIEAVPVKSLTLEYLVIIMFLGFPFLLSFFTYRMSVEWLWVSPILATFVISLDIVFIFFTLSYVRKYYDYLKTTPSDLKLKKLTIFVCNSILVLSLLTTLYFSYKVAYIYLEGYKIPFNVVNYQKVKDKTEADYGELRSYELMYFNDVYTFVAIEQKDSDIKRTVIYKTQDILF